MKSAFVSSVCLAALLGSVSLAQEVSTDRLRVEEIVASGRGVLLPLNDALAPLAETEEEAEATNEDASDVTR